LASGIIVAGIVTALGACSSTADGRQDTGYGAGQTAPVTENCTNLCQRVADCGVHLCDEDKSTTAYLGSLSLLENACESSCTDAQITANISPTQWQCLFHDSCRMVLGNNSCGTANTSYTCG